MNQNSRPARFLGLAALMFVSLFAIDTAFTLWVSKEPYSLGRTVGYNLLLALVFALMDWVHDPFGRNKRRGS